MKADEFIQDLVRYGGGTLMHYADPNYDPQKAKEYYERTKKLKGRERARQEDAASKGQSKAGGPSAAERAASTSEANKARVESIRGKMSKLDDSLKTLIKKRNEKRPDSSKETTESSTSKEKKTASKEESEKDPLTTSEKAKKAKKAREEYESVAEKEPSEPTLEELDAKITKVRKQIAELKEKLQVVLEKTRSQPSANRNKSDTKTASSR